MSMHHVEARGLLERRYTPVALLVPTPRSDEVAQELGFEQGMLSMLRPLMLLKDDVHLSIGRDPNDVRHVALSKFAFRLHTTATLAEPPSSTRALVVGASMRACGTSELSNAQSQLLPVLEKIAASKVSMPTGGKEPDASALRMPDLGVTEATRLVHASFPQWFPNFTADYCAMLRYSYMDTIDHPACAIYTVVASDSIAQVLQDLRSADGSTLVPLLQSNPSVDPGIIKVVILFADAATPGQTDAGVDSQRRAILDKFCPEGLCHIVRFDSRERPDGTAPIVDPSVFTRHDDFLGFRTDETIQRSRSRSVIGGPDASPSPPRRGGPRVPQRFWNDLGTAVQTAVNKVVVAHLPKKLRDLREHIDQQRQSFTDRIASFFGKREAKPQRDPFQYRDRGDPIYWYHSLEMSMRRAGDLSLMLHDYEGAVFYFKLCRDELDEKLKERAWNRNLLASAVEGIGIAQVLGGKAPLPCDPVRQDSKLELSRDLYTKFDVHSHAFKSALILISVCRVRSTPANDRARKVLQTMLAGRAPPLYRAMQLDQLAQAFLVTDPPFPGTLGSSDGILQGVSNPSLRQVHSSYQPSCAPRKYAQQMTLAATAYSSPEVSPPQEEHALRCALAAWAVLKHRKVRSYPDLVRAALRTLVRSYKRAAMTPEALQHAVELCRSGWAERIDVEVMLELLRAYLLIHTEWAPSASSEEVAPTEGSTRSATQVAPVAGVPVVSPASVRVQGEPFTCDEATAAEEESYSIVTDRSAVAVDPGFAAKRALQAWDNTLDDLRRAVGSLRLSMPRSVQHYALQSRVEATVSRRLLQEHGSDPVAALRCARRVKVAQGKRIALELVLTNPLTSASLQVSDVALLVYKQPADGEPPRTLSRTCLDSTTHRLEDADGKPVTFTIDAGTAARMPVPFSTAAAGTSTIVGVRWTLEGVSCDTFFAACAEGGTATVAADDTTVADSLKLASSGIPREHKSHTTVVVAEEEPVVVTTFDPPLPAAMRDGELFFTSLVISNEARVSAASNVRVFFGRCCYHLMALDHAKLPAACSMSVYSGDSRVVAVNEPLAPGTSQSVPLIFRAQGCWSCHVPRLEGVAPPASATNTILALSMWTPPVPANARPGQIASLPVQLGKLLRSIRVHRALEIGTVVVPPTSADMPITIGVSVENAAARVANKRPPLPLRTASVPPGGNAPAPAAVAENENAVKVLRVTAVSLGFNVLALDASSVASATAAIAPGSKVSLPVCATPTLVATESALEGLPSAARGGSGQDGDALAEAVSRLLKMRVEQHCISLSSTASAAEGTDVAALVGEEVAKCTWMAHFAATGPATGPVTPDCDPPTDEGLGFYADGGDSENREAMEARAAAEAARRLKAARERAHVAMLSPVLLCVLWRARGNFPDAPNRVGIAFHAVDATELRKVTMLRRPAFEAASTRAFERAATAQPLIAGTGSLAVTAEGLEDTVEGCFALPSAVPGAAASCISVTGSFDVVLANHSAERLSVRLNAEPVFGSGMDPHPPFTFVGATSKRVSVDPRGVARVTLKPCFFAPGTYNVCCIQIEARAVGPTPVDVTVTGNDIPWLMTVRSRAPIAADTAYTSPLRTAPVSARRTIPMPSAQLCAVTDAALGDASPFRSRRRGTHAASPHRGGGASPISRLLDASEAAWQADASGGDAGSVVAVQPPVAAKAAPAAVEMAAEVAEALAAGDGAHLVAAASGADLDRLEEAIDASNVPVVEPVRESLVIADNDEAAQTAETPERGADEPNDGPVDVTSQDGDVAAEQQRRPTDAEPSQVGDDEEPADETDAEASRAAATHADEPAQHPQPNTLQNVMADAASPTQPDPLRDDTGTDGTSPVDESVQGSAPRRTVSGAEGDEEDDVDDDATSPASPASDSGAHDAAAKAAPTARDMTSPVSPTKPLFPDASDDDEEAKPATAARQASANLEAEDSDDDDDDSEDGVRDRAAAAMAASGRRKNIFLSSDDDDDDDGDGQAPTAPTQQQQQPAAPAAGEAEPLGQNAVSDGDDSSSSSDCGIETKNPDTVASPDATSAAAPTTVASMRHTQPLTHEESNMDW